MKIKQIVDEDFVNYRLPSMYIIMPECDFKCDRECGRTVCQNSRVAKMDTIEMDTVKIIERYDANPITHAIVFSGLEPFDTPESLWNFLMVFRYNHADTIVIYTGYTKEEVEEKFPWVFLYENVVIKYGRFIPDQESHYDPILGVNLASPNQYAEVYNECGSW